MAYSPQPAGYGAPRQNIAGYKQAQLPTMNPQQNQLFQSLLGANQGGATAGTDFLSKLAGGDQSIFQQMEAPAYTAFNKQIGELGSRFSHFGGRNSSGFENAAAGAAGDLGERIGANRSNLQMQAIQALLGQSNQLLNTNTFQNVLTPESHDQSGAQFMGLLGKLLPILIGGLAGGPAGAAAGGLGSFSSSMLSR